MVIFWTVFIVSYLLSLVICLFLQRKLYDHDGSIMEIFVFGSFIPVFNILLAIVLLVVYFQEFGQFRDIAKTLLGVKDKSC